MRKVYVCFKYNSIKGGVDTNIFVNKKQAKQYAKQNDCNVIKVKSLDKKDLISVAFDIKEQQKADGIE